MKTNGIAALTLKVCLIVALAGAANACVLVGPGGAKGGGGGEVTLCHKGKKTMTLPAEAAGAHMDHGDHRGSC